MLNSGVEMTGEKLGEDLHSHQTMADSGGYSFSTESIVDEEDHQDHRGRAKYSRRVIKVAKKLLARYVILNKCVCLFMIWLHVTMGLLSIMIASRTSDILSEATLCRYIFYSSHYFYGYINILLCILYIYLYLSIPSIIPSPQSDCLYMIFFLLGLYVWILKILSMMSCVFMGISWLQIFMQGGQWALEGIGLKMYIDWIDKGTRILRANIEEYIDDIMPR
jgi:hypothetical protein